MTRSCLLLLDCLLLIILASSTTKSTATATATVITIPLSPLPTKHPSSDPCQILNSLAISSLSRAHHLKTKTHKNKNISSSLVKTPLSSHSYGGYSVSLSFGKPRQTVPLIFDTGSSLVWLPCTSRYVCSRCNFANTEPTQIPTYKPKLSSSSKLIGCKNRKCSLLFGPNVKSTCQDCDANSNHTCTQTCPPYIIQYGSGSTVGLLLSDTLVFPRQTVPDFLFGCSTFSVRQPAGIAGFGRAPESLPRQMGLKKFSYCLVSRRFDDTPVSSSLVLDTGSGTGSKTPAVSYTPFSKNPVGSDSAFGEYYYVGLRKITVGNKHVKIPYKYLVPGPDGSGGTIVDSGSTFTFMERPVFEAVAQEFIKQMGNYSRAAEVEGRTGLKPCFHISSQKSMAVPGFDLQFKGGAKMRLPLENYFAFLNKDVICLMVATDNGIGAGPQLSVGPAIILGNFQQQNFYLEFDLANERFGFARQKCT